MPLDPANQRYLTAAEGYLELGMFPEAQGELLAMDANTRLRPEFLAVQLGVFQGLKSWAMMRNTAQRLHDLQPDELQWSISLAYAIRRSESLDAARAALLGTLKQHPEEALIYYNLACYDCQLGDLPSAQNHLDHALTLQPVYLQLAMEDSDLEPLWPKLQRPKRRDLA